MPVATAPEPSPAGVRAPDAPAPGPAQPRSMFPWTPEPLPVHPFEKEVDRPAMHSAIALEAPRAQQVPAPDRPEAHPVPRLEAARVPPGPAMDRPSLPPAACGEAERLPQVPERHRPGVVAAPPRMEAERPPQMAVADRRAMPSPRPEEAPLAVPGPVTDRLATATEAMPLLVRMKPATGPETPLTPAGAPLAEPGPRRQKAVPHPRQDGSRIGQLPAPTLPDVGLERLQPVQAMQERDAIPFASPPLVAPGPALPGAALPRLGALPEPEPAIARGWSGEPGPVSAPRSLPAAGMPAGAAPSVAHQLAQAAPALSDGRVEIRLAPEELGRVLLALSISDGSVTVAVLAERSETLDLLRRNIGLLQQELRDLGYANPGFSFGEGRQSPAGGHASHGPDAADGALPAQATALASAPGLQLSGGPAAGLDLRL